MMAPRSPRQIGTAFESLIRDYLRVWWPDVDRQPLRGSRDEGDLKGVPNWTCELKATKSYDLPTAVAQAKIESRVAGTKWWAAIIKRRGHGPASAFVVMDVAQWVEIALLLEQANGGRKKRRAA